ncbi:invasion associated locus B family protein [Methylobacterium sp. J-076]|uniref:invasion associated locus B family protein n=1 Tax=Methylobacterium sp. J-076 TaxID=2836655 RepID=UPI001FBA3D44|nr:invasion associated locus B family protein [Methylobacterium sp. J-076]MCJ2013615.1 invasion associated locus B family protein [Methylobacterium sp. J-076]
MEQRFRPAIRPILLILATTRLGSAAEVGQPTSAPPAIERFGSWETVCDRPAAPAAERPTGSEPAQPCKVVQRQVDRKTGQSVFVVTALPAGRSNQIAAIVSTPLGGYLAPGMVLSVDGGRPFKVLFETCTVTGCHAGFALSGRIAQEMRRGRELKVRLWTGKGRPADVAVPLTGFDAALAALRLTRP